MKSRRCRMTAMMLNEYQIALQARIDAITVSNHATAHLPRQVLTPMCTMVDQHLIQGFKAHFSNNANAPKYFYKQGWNLRKMECDYLDAVVTRANFIKDEALLKDELSWIQRQAPQVGYLGSGQQDAFQQQIKEVLDRCDKVAALPSAAVKIQVSVDEIVTLHANAEAADKLANSIIIGAAADGKDSKERDNNARITLATVLKTDGIKAETANIIGVAILTMDRAAQTKAANDLQVQKAQHEKQMHDSKTALSAQQAAALKANDDKHLAEVNALKAEAEAEKARHAAEIKSWRETMHSVSVMDNHFAAVGTGKDTGSGASPEGVQLLTATPSATAPPAPQRTMFYAQQSSQAPVPVVVEGSPAAASAGIVIASKNQSGGAAAASVPPAAQKRVLIPA